MASIQDEGFLILFEHSAKNFGNMSICEEDNPTDKVFLDERVFHQVISNPQFKQYLDVFCFNYFIRKDYQKIKILLKRAIKYQPDCLTFKFNLALAYYLTNDVNQALTLVRNIDIHLLQAELDTKLDFLEQQETDF